MASRALQVLVTSDTSQFRRGMHGIDSEVDRSEKRLHRFGKIGAAALSGVGLAAAAGAAVGIKKSAQAAIEAEQAQSKMVTQLKAAGVSYKAHARQIDEVIQKTSRLSGLDDEDLQNSFTNIVRVTGDVNKSLRLTGLAADFARAKHMDVAKAGELVGKVAGGNTGILSRYGITVQKGATAQEALALLQGKFAGQAEAYGKTTQGAMDRAGVASENLGEIVGAKLTPLLAKGATALVDLIDKSGSLAGPIRTASGAVRRAYDTAAAAVRRFMVNNREDIDQVIKAVRNLGRFVKNVFEDVVIPMWKRLIPVIKGVAEGIVTILRGLVRIVTGIVNGDWRQVWEGIKDIPRGAVKALKTIAAGLWRALRDGIKELVPLALKAAESIGKAIKDGIVAGIKGIGGAIGNAVTGALDKINPFGDGVGIGRQIGQGFAGSGIGGGALMGADPDLAPFASIGSRFGLRVTSGLRPGSITSSGNRSYHSSGDAIDESGPASGMLGYFRYLKSHFGSRLRELIYTPGGVGIKDGRPFRYTGQVARDHFDHVHVAYTGPFGDGIGQAAQAARAAGFRGRALVDAVAIAGAESRYLAGAQNLRYPDHSIGMWQINQLAHHGRYGSDAQLKDPFRNARAAFAISGGGRNFGPWSTWPRAAAAYMARAQAAIAGLSGGGASGAGGGRGSANTYVGNVGQGGGQLGKTQITSGKAGAGTPGLGVPGGGNIGELPSGTDYIDALIAEAALTPGMEDDRAALETLRDYWTRELGSARASGDPRKVTAAAQGLKGVRDALDGLNDTIRQEQEQRQRLADELAGLRAEVKQQNEFAKSVAGIASREAVRALADVISGQIVGVGLQGRRGTAGTGRAVLVP